MQLPNGYVAALVMFPLTLANMQPPVTFTPSANVPTFTASFAVPTTAGKRVIAFFGVNNNAETLTVKDGLGNLLGMFTPFAHQDPMPQNQFYSIGEQIFFGIAAGSKDLVGTLSTPANPHFIAFELDGADTIDTSSLGFSGDTQTDGPNCPPLKTTMPNDWLFLHVVTGNLNHTFVVGAGWQLFSTSTGASAVAFQERQMPGSYSASVRLNSPDYWIANCVAVKPLTNQFVVTSTPQ